MVVGAVVSCLPGVCGKQDIGVWYLNGDALNSSFAVPFAPTIPILAVMVNIVDVLYCQCRGFDLKGALVASRYFICRFSNLVSVLKRLFRVSLLPQGL